MRLSAKVSGAPPEMNPRAKPGAKAKAKSSAPSYDPDESYEHDEGEYDEASYAPPPGRGKPNPKAKAAAKAASNGFQFQDEDETPRPPPMPPPKKKAAMPKNPSGGAQSTPMTPAPKQATIRPVSQEPAWEENNMGEDAAMEENGDEHGDGGWDEAPPAKKIKMDAFGDGWEDPGIQKGSWGHQGKGKGKGKGKNWNQQWGNQGWGQQAYGDDWGGKGKSGNGAMYGDCDGIQDGLLPIQQRMEEVVAAVCGPCPVCCIGGDTGSGKSTQVPQIIFKDACDKMQEVKIAVVQPRRVAAVSLARRVAHELGESGPGGLVGHRIGGDSTPGFAIDFCSTGYFLQLLVNAPGELGRYSHVVLDEVHERSAESDLLCFVVRRLVSGPHKGIRIIIMSATVNMQLFSSYFSRLVETGDKPAEVFVGKKCFPVAEYFLEELVEAFPDFRCGHEIGQRIVELFPEGFKKANSWSKKTRIDARHVEKFNNIVVDILRCLWKGGSTIVVFLPGIAEITTLWQEARLLQDGGQFQVLPLHSMIPQEEQQAVFAKADPTKTRVILATDIAESSITLPDITAIVDFGMHRRMDHGNARSLAALTTKWISRDAAKQRAGRAGRTQPGICIRLYSQHWFEQVMEQHEPPETQSMPLDRLYLQAKQLCEKLGQTSKIQRSAKAALLELVQSPDVEKIAEARMELADLGAIDCPEESAKITRFGQLCTQLPLDLRLSRMVWLGVIFGCAADGVVFAAVTSCNDPFQFPAAHFSKSEDDFASWLRETTASRLLFDGGLQSEPMMLRQLFLEWLVTLHEKHQPWGSWTKVNQARKKHTENFARMYRLAKGRMDHIVSQVVDLALRTFHACAAGTRACKQLRELIRLLGYSINEKGDLSAVSREEVGDVKALLHGDDPIFEDNTNILRGLLAANFSDFLLLGTYAGGGDAEWQRSKWNPTHNKKNTKETQLELLKAVSEKQVDVHHTAWYPTQKDDPVLGIEKFVDHVCGHSVAKPQVVLEGQNMVFVEFEGEQEPWPELSSKKISGDPIGSQYQFNILNHYASSMKEVQRFKGNLSCEWTYGVHTLSHPHLVQWELMQPSYDWGGKPIRCNAILERRNAVGFVTRTPVTDENFGLVRRIACFAVASSLHANENSKVVYPVGVTTLQAPHIAFVLATSKFSNSSWGSRFGITAERSLCIQGNCVDLPNGLLTQEWWEKIQKMRSAIRRELLNSLDQDEESALERACSGVAPLVLSDAEDVQQCMCALLEDAENFHGKEAVEALEECNKTCDLVLYDAKDLPVAMQPLAPWDTIENAASKAKVQQTFQPEGSKGFRNFSGGKGNQGKGGGQQWQGGIKPAWVEKFQGQLGTIRPVQPGMGGTIRPVVGKGAQGGLNQGVGKGAGANLLSSLVAGLNQAAEEDEPQDEDEEEKKPADEDDKQDEETAQEEGTNQENDEEKQQGEENGAGDENDEEMADGENAGEGEDMAVEDEGQDGDENVPKVSSLGLLGAGFGRKVFGA